MKKLFFVLGLCLVFSLQYSNSRVASEIQWVDFEEAVELQKTSFKKIFMFIYTDWCDYCNYTKETLLQYQPFIDAVNNQFIPVKFNAEQTQTVDFNGHELGIQEESGYHYLPILLMEGKMEFPGFVFFNEELQVISKQGGVKDDVVDFTEYVNYIGTDSYKEVKWIDYNSNK